MNWKKISDSDRKILLQLARQSIEMTVVGQRLPEIDLNQYSPILQAKGAAFVTLTRKGQLRGCIGALEAYQPLVLDVCEHAAAAAVEDYRFHPVEKEELPEIQIEISCLTAPEKMEYSGPTDLTARLRPHLDGVILKDGFRRATFLPQVWEQLPDPEGFLEHLCRKMGAPRDLWKTKHLEVEIYGVEEFEE